MQIAEFKENFLMALRPDTRVRPSLAPEWDELLWQAHGAIELLSEYGGTSFGGGIYRLHQPAHLERWTSILEEAFPTHKGRGPCFGYDWLGSHFVLDRLRTEDGEPLVLMFEPGTGEVLEITATFEQFHNQELVSDQEAVLARSFYEQWSATTRHLLSTEECAGYTVPLFLGGKDTVENLEVIDMEAYWSICGQLLNRIQGLPPGSTIKDVSIS